MMHIKTNPYKAVSFNEKAVEKALKRSHYLIADIKYDGVRGNTLVKPSQGACWLSRVSKPIPAIEHLNEGAARWDNLLKDNRCMFPTGFMLDGELMVDGVDFNTGSGLLRTKWLDSKNQEFHNEFLPRKVKKSEKIPFRLDAGLLKVVIYAVLPIEVAESGDDYPVKNLLMQEHVKNMLPLLRAHFPEISWQAAESHEVYDMTELSALYEMKREEGHEGLIVKDPSDIYKRGKKTGWWKMKPENEADGVIQGLVWGTKGLANEGKVIGFEVLLESGRVVNACNIAQSLMNEFTAAVETHGEDYYNGWACQISYMEETPDGSLRHPSFVMFRGTEAEPTEKM
ncbi:DNA ligase [Aeromonas phage avDM11-UST]|nr:DNA ligase [Aeromonas phage avDM11-UST]